MASKKRHRMTVPEKAGLLLRLLSLKPGESATWQFGSEEESKAAFAFIKSAVTRVPARKAKEKAI